MNDISRKYPYLYHGCFLEFHRQGGFFELEIQRHEVTYDWNSKDMGGGWGGGGSREDRQKCENTNALMTLLTTVGSKIQDKY